MLGLRQEIARHMGGIGRRIGQDDNFRRPRDHVDSDAPEHPPLGGRHIGVAGADDLRHRRDRLGAVGERRDGLRAPDPINLVDPGEFRRHKHQRVEQAIRRRHHHDDALAARHLGGNGIHQNGGRIGGGAAGNVEPDRTDRRPAPAEFDAERIGPELVGRLLPLVERQDAVAREAQGAAGLGGHPGRCPGDLVRPDPQPQTGDVDAIEPGRQIRQGRIAARHHVRDDGGRGRVDVLRHLPLGHEERAERVFEILRPRVEPHEIVHDVD